MLESVVIWQLLNCIQLNIMWTKIFLIFIIQYYFWSCCNWYSLHVHTLIKRHVCTCSQTHSTNMYACTCMHACTHMHAHMCAHMHTLSRSLFLSVCLSVPLSLAETEKLTCWDLYPQVINYHFSLFMLVASSVFCKAIVYTSYLLFATQLRQCNI